MTLSLYQPTRAAAMAFSVAASPARRILPGGVRRRLDRAHVTILGSHEGKHDEAIARADRALDQSDPAILLQRAKAARFAGRIAEALGLAERVVELAESQQLVDYGAHAIFETIFAYTWTGDYDAARRALGRFHHGVDALAGVRWMAWSEWHAGCLDIYANRPDLALEHLAESRSLFRDDGLVGGEVSALTVELTARRMLDDQSGLNTTNIELLKLSGKRGWTSYTNDSIAIELLLRRYVVEDPLRLRPDVERFVNQSAGEPVLQCLALLCLAEIDLALGQDGVEAVERARTLGLRSGLRYIVAHAAITDHRSGRSTTQDTLDAIHRTGCQLATRTGSPAVEIEDFCLGTHRERHELFFP